MFSAVPPASTDTKKSAEYSATIGGRPVFVHAAPGFAGGTVSWVALDHDFAAGGPLEFLVTAHRNVDEVSLRPLSAGVAATLDADERTARFTLARTGHFFLKWDGTFQLPFYLFVNPPDLTAGTPPAPRVRVFGPGRHHPGQIRLTSGDTLHLAAGAEVYATLIAEDAEDIRICGRGILRGSHIPFGGTADERYMICLRRCRRVSVEGVTIIDGFGWTVIAHHCEDIVFRWLKIMTERLWSTDGINPCASRRVLVEDCFIRSKDDCVAVKGLDWEHPDPRDWQPLHDITVRRIVGWSDNNNGFVVGAETRSPEIARVIFEDCDLLHVSNTCGDEAAALTITALDDTRLHDILFRDIRIEFALGPLLNVYFTDTVFDIPGTRLPVGGEIADVTFDRITLHEGPSRRSYLRGLDATRTLRRITLRDITVRGRPVKTAADLRLAVNPHVHGLVIA